MVSELCDPLDGHATTVAAWLSGTIPKRTIAEDVHNGITIDQVIAKQIGQDTVFPSLELATEDFTGYIGGCDTQYACAYMNTLSWASPTQPLPMEINPRVTFERMFGRAGTAGQRLARMQNDKSILDSVQQDVKDLQGGLGPKDRARLSDYLENVREIEKRIQKAEKQATTEVTVPDAPIGVPESFEEHVGLQFDLLALAYEANITKVFTFMMSRDASQRVYPNLGFAEPHHSMSHHGNNPEKLANLVKLNTYHVSLFAKFLDKLASTPGRRRLDARSLADPLRQRHERERHALAPQRPGRHRGRRRRRAEGQPSHPGAERNAAGEPDARHREQVRLRDGQVRHAQHRPVRGLRRLQLSNAEDPMRKHELCSRARVLVIVVLMFRAWPASRPAAIPFA